MEDNSSLMKPDLSDHKGAVGEVVSDSITGRGEGAVAAVGDVAAAAVGRDTKIKLTASSRAR
jgi:hypothetical protein